MARVFSSRTRWSASPNPLSLLLERRRSQGAPLLDLTESNPTRVGLGFPEEPLRAALAAPGAAGYEPDPRGCGPAREAIAAYYRDRRLPVAPERVVLSASTSEAYAWLFKLLANPGDEVLVPQPSYPLFEFLAGLESVRTVGYPLRYDGEWHLDRGALEAAIGGRTRAVVAVSPNNPTGSFLKRDELSALAGLCARHGLALLCDEVFADYAFADDARRASSVLESEGALAFALSGLSKVACLPQLKVGWLVATGPERLVAEALERLEIVADTYLSVNGPAQRALPALLAARGAVQGPLRARLAHNLAALKATHRTDDAWQPLTVEGGWSAIVRLPRRLSEQEWVERFVEEDGVLVHPGFFFDFPGEAFVALSLLPEPEVFAEGVGRIARRVRSA